MTDVPLAENEHLFTSESVTEGHPDKVSDQISDAVLDAVMAHGEGEDARVACETLVNTNLVVISGEIRTEAKLDLDKIARDTIREIGYDGFDPHFGADTVEVLERMDQQSADIAQGVDAAQEAREEGSEDDEDLAGRRRPGNDVRLREQRDPRADAAADLARPQARQAAGRRPQGRHPRLPAPRRQDPGHGPLPRRQAGRDRARADLHPARRGSRPRQPDPPRPDRARDRAGAARRPLRPRAHRRDASSSTRPAASSSAARSATAASPAARSSSTPTAAWPATAAAPSRARTRRRSTARPPTPRATSPRTSSPPASPTAARSRSPTRSASPTRCR